MIVSNYRFFMIYLSKYFILKSIMNLYIKSFNDKLSMYEILKWFRKRLTLQKDDVILCVDNKNNVLAFGVCDYEKKFNKKIVYGKYAKTETYVFLSNLCSIQKGCGKNIMAHIISMCNIEEYDIILIARTKKLITYYERLGFKVINNKKQVMIKYTGVCDE